MEAARAASRERVKAKHGEHRGKLLKAEKLIHTQSEQIASLQARLKRAERAANTADGDRATKSGKAGVVVHRGEKLYHVMHSPGGLSLQPVSVCLCLRPRQRHPTRCMPAAINPAHASCREWAWELLLFDLGSLPVNRYLHVSDSLCPRPGDRNVANHQDAVQYNYRHHDAAWDGNRVPTEGRGDRLDRHVSRYPDYDAPSSPGGYNFVYGKDETYAPQDYGSYYGPQAYYDGYYRGGDGSTERQTRNGAGRTGRGTQGRGRHVYAYASPYDRSEEFRQHENYVNMFYRWYTTATNENQQQSISDAQKWQYNAAIQQYDAYLRDATGRDT